MPRRISTLALALKYSGDSAAAAAEFEDALKYKPGWPEAHYALGAVHYEQGDLAAAKSELRRSLELEPKNDKVRLYFANVLLADGRPKDALEVLRLAEHTPSEEALLGRAYLQSGFPEKAVEQLRLSPASAENRYYLGIALGQEGALPRLKRLSGRRSLLTQTSARHMRV